MKTVMQLVRPLIVACGLFSASASAQSPLVGKWNTKEHQVGDINITITGVTQNGFIEGKYEVPKQAIGFTFKVDQAQPEGTGRLDHQGVLTIITPNGKTYTLRYVNGQLVGKVGTRWGPWDSKFKRVIGQGS